MASMPRAVDRLIDALSRLPGIGPKTASRLTYHLLRTGEEEAVSLAEALLALHRQTIVCSQCYNISETDPCEICVDLRRISRRDLFH